MTNPTQTARDALLRHIAPYAHLPEPAQRHLSVLVNAWELRQVVAPFASANYGCEQCSTGIVIDATVDHQLWSEIEAASGKQILCATCMAGYIAQLRKWPSISMTNAHEPAFAPPPEAEREDGYECLVLVRNHGWWHCTWKAEWRCWLDFTGEYEAREPLAFAPLPALSETPVEEETR